MRYRSQHVPQSDGQKALTRLKKRIEKVLRDSAYPVLALQRIGKSLKDDEKRVLIATYRDPTRRAWILAYSRYVNGASVEQLAIPSCVTTKRMNDICEEGLSLAYERFTREIMTERQTAIEAVVADPNRAASVYVRECCQIVTRSRFTTIPSNSVDWTKSLFLEGVPS